MRLIFFLMVLCLGISPAFGADDNSFDSFMKSREVVATLYFQANSEGLDKVERERISVTVSRLRQLQNEGRLIRVEGFSSPEGDKETNYHLSFFRARAVADLIEAEGLPAEVTLTGYGDMHAKSDNFDKERRVEIASYVKPVGMKKIEVANREAAASSETQPCVTQATVRSERDIDSFAIDRAIKQKLANKQQKLADKQRNPDPTSAPGISQVISPEEPIIDALTIEQAIMEKIGAEPSQAPDAVSQISAEYQPR